MMAKFWPSFRNRRNTEVARYTLDDYLNNVSLAWQNGYLYSQQSSPYDNKEVIENDFCTYANNIYKRSGVVFATMEVRRANFSQIRFQWENIEYGSNQLGKIFGTAELAPLETPWPNGATNDLLSRMEQDVSLSGNAYVVREGNRLRRLQPDWVTPVLSAPHAEAVQSDVVGYVYTPGGYNSGAAEQYYLVEDVAHWAPVPNPTYQYIGLSWLQTILTEFQSDRAAGEHKLNFFRNGATLGTVISPKESTTIEQFKQFMEVTNASHVGTRNAYKPLYLGMPADVQVVSASGEQIDFNSTQGRDETRIAMAGRVPAVILGISEGLGGSSLNQGNFNSARRNFVDGFLWSHWTSVCTALQTIVDVPNGCRLWFVTKDVPLLREDQMDAAKIVQTHATTITLLVREGFTAESAKAAVISGDMSKLQHTGLVSVQLQPPGTQFGAVARTVHVSNLHTLTELLALGWTPVNEHQALELESGAK